MSSVKDLTNEYSRGCDAISYFSYASTLPNLNCAQLMLPSFNVHNLSPLSVPAAPTPTWIGSRCPKVGCAFLASGLDSSSTIALSLSSPIPCPSNASFKASSNVSVDVFQRRWFVTYDESDFRRFGFPPSHTP